MIKTTEYGITRLVGTDFDGDGDTDVVTASSSFDRITWYENDGSENFTYRTMATNINPKV